MKNKRAFSFSATCLPEANNEREKASRSGHVVDDFSLTFAHDARSLIHGILGLSELISEETTNPNHLYYLNKISKSGDILVELINKFLDYSKLGSKKLKPINSYFNVQNLLDDISELYMDVAEAKGLDFKVEINNSPSCSLYGDRVFIFQVLNNLISNAFKFTSVGQVTLVADFSVQNNNVCNARFEIRDTGIGISSELLEDIFEDYTQEFRISSKTRDGIGIGLSITKELVFLMGGEIKVTSKKNCGSNFVIHLPFNIGSQPLTQHDCCIDAVDVDRFSINRFAPNILVVEDCTINRAIITSMLKDMGCTIEHASNGQAALDMVNKDSSYDLIFMDCHLPIMDGFDAAKNIRLNTKQSISTPIIALTADTSPGVVSRCKESGMLGYISKPFTRSDINKTIQETINHCW